MTTPNAVTKFDLNDLVRFSATFVSTDGVTPADPSTITFLILNPSGAVACYDFVTAGASITRAGVGAYYKDVTLNQVGSWFYRYEGTGGVQAAEEWGVVVQRSFIL